MRRTESREFGFERDFNFDFNVGITEEQEREGRVEYNYRRERALQWRKGEEGGGEGPVAEIAAMTGTDVARTTRSRQSISRCRANRESCAKCGDLDQQ